MSRASRPPLSRWPDLLIGLLVVLLLAGFALLLLGQGREAVTATAPPPPVAEELPDIPAAPGTDLGTDLMEEAAPAPEASTTATPEETTATPAAEAAAPREETPAARPSTPPAAQPTPAPSAASPSSAAPEASAPAASPATSTGTPATAPAPEDAPAVVAATPIPAAPPPPPVPEVTLPQPETTVPLPPPAAQAPSAAGEGTRSEPSPSTSTSNAPTSSAAPARSGTVVAPSEERTPLRSDYRISLGTFGSEAEARRAAAGVADAGYPVYVIDLGNQVVAQVGPYADETTARRALADIQPRAPRAVLYAPRGRSLTGGGSETTQANAPAPATAPAETAAPPEAAPAEPEAPATAQAPAPSGPVYLQVGAFDRQESAGRLVGMLRDLGFSPTVNAPEGRKVTVLVGPYSGEALLEAERKLDANGHDHFRIR